MLCGIQRYFPVRTERRHNRRNHCVAEFADSPGARSQKRGKPAAQALFITTGIDSFESGARLDACLSRRHARTSGERASSARYANRDPRPMGRERVCDGAGLEGPAQQPHIPAHALRPRGHQHLPGALVSDLVRHPAVSRGGASRRPRRGRRQHCSAGRRGLRQHLQHHRSPENDRASCKRPRHTESAFHRGTSTGLAVRIEPLFGWLPARCFLWADVELLGPSPVSSI